MRTTNLSGLLTHQVEDEYTHWQIRLKSGAVLTFDCESIASWASIEDVYECRPDGYIDSADYLDDNIFTSDDCGFKEIESIHWTIDNAEIRPDILWDKIEMTSGEIILVNDDHCVIFKNVDDFNHGRDVCGLRLS